MFSSDAQRVLQSVWRVQIIHGQSIGSVPAAHHDDPLRSKGIFLAAEHLVAGAMCPS